MLQSITNVNALAEIWPLVPADLTSHFLVPHLGSYRAIFCLEQREDASDLSVIFLLVCRDAVIGVRMQAANLILYVIDRRAPEGV